MRKLMLFVAAVVIATAAGAFVGTALTPVAPPRAPNVRGPVVTPPLQKLVVTSPYGPRVLRGKLGVHRGVDLRARTGTPLASVGAGVVAKTHRTKKGGLSVVVQLDDGWRAGYAHMSRIDVTPGARLAPGARVGLSGDTGTEGAPHLHFELRDPKSKSLVDPWPHLARHGSPTRTRLAAAQLEAEARRALFAASRADIARTFARADVHVARTLARTDVARILARTDVARILARTDARTDVARTLARTLARTNVARSIARAL